MEILWYPTTRGRQAENVDSIAYFVRRSGVVPGPPGEMALTKQGMGKTVKQFQWFSTSSESQSWFSHKRAICDTSLPYHPRCLQSIFQCRRPAMEIQRRESLPVFLFPPLVGFQGTSTIMERCYDNWNKMQEEIRLQTKIHCSSLLPAHFEAITSCFDEMVTKAPISDRTKLVLFLTQLRVHLPKWQGSASSPVFLLCLDHLSLRLQWFPGTLYLKFLQETQIMTETSTRMLVLWTPQLLSCLEKMDSSLYRWETTGFFWSQTQN